MELDAFSTQLLSRARCWAQVQGLLRLGFCGLPGMRV